MQETKNHTFDKPHGGFYFFTIVTFNLDLFLSTSLYRAILNKAWEKAQSTNSFTLDAICLLPDHFHCLLKSNGRNDKISEWLQSIKNTYTRAYLKLVDSERSKNNLPQRIGNNSSFQRHYWEHLIRNEEDYQKHFDYIHYNPIRHGYAEHPSEWKWSTYHSYLTESIYSEQWGEAEPASISGNGHFGE